MCGVCHASAGSREFGDCHVLVSARLRKQKNKSCGERHGGGSSRSELDTLIDKLVSKDAGNLKCTANQFHTGPHTGPIGNIYIYIGTCCTNAYRIPSPTKSHQNGSQGHQNDSPGTPNGDKMNATSRTTKKKHLKFRGHKSCGESCQSDGCMVFLWV